ncbi:MAG: type II toxin-antitoxin system RelE/ParE family toxin, partial [Candidatus Micrarchaeaceae archaeon]
MSYRVIWSERSQKDLSRLDKKTIGRIITKVNGIKENPFLYVKRLVGVPLYSLRAGDYRVIMDIKNRQLIIF